MQTKEQTVVSNRPIRRLRITEDDSDLVLDLRESLAQIAALPPAMMTPGEASQYLSVALDWGPQGSDPARRPARRQFEDAANAILAEYAKHSPAARTLAVDIERVGRYLDNERIDRQLDVEPLPAAAQGVLVFARADADVFVALPLAVAVPTEVTVGPIPALATLARIADDHATYAVLLADQKEASLVFVTQSRREREVVAYGAEYPLKRKAGGSQRRYQARAGERHDQFTRAIADGTRQALDDAGVDVLIIAGDEVMTSPLNQFLHHTVANRIVGTVRLDITTPTQDLIDATLPLDEEAERGREAAAAAALRNAVESGGPGAAGPDAVLTALKQGQVETLVMNDDFAAVGWADYSADVAGIGAIPDRHPTGGERGQIVPIRAEDELIRRAILTGATYEIVRTEVPVPPAGEPVPRAEDERPRTDAGRQLDELGGVGALLRFS
jgi:hypothetical protein